jgi:hypothetical protein
LLALVVLVLQKEQFPRRSIRRNVTSVLMAARIVLINDWRSD